MNQTLVIKNVDLELLEQQRISLNRYLMGMKMVTGDLDNLQGLSNVLTSWSDERYYKKLGSLENQKAEQRQLSLPGMPINDGKDK